MNRPSQNKSLGSYEHPVLLITWMQQCPGAESCAKILKADLTDKKEIFSVDISFCYKVPGLKKLTCEFAYLRGKREPFQITDELFGFTTLQTFESALIARFKWKKISANQLIVEGKAEKLIVTITSDQGAFSLESEGISEEKGEPSTRLTLHLDSCVKVETYNGIFACC